MQWISVKDRLPSPGSRVLVFHAYIDMKYYENSMFFDGEEHCYCPVGVVLGVTH